jgi:hypothetical protein
MTDDSAPWAAPLTPAQLTTARRIAADIEAAVDGR